jgi:murein L,D-transpeptidase YcbB/YkuD
MNTGIGFFHGFGSTPTSINWRQIYLAEFFPLRQKAGEQRALGHVRE